MILKNYPNAYETDLLIFRPLDLADAKPWSKFLEDKKATALFPASLTENPFINAMTWIERQICRYRDQQGGLMAIVDKQTGAFMGQSGLIIQEVDGQKVLEVGYHLLPAYWGNGYATEASQFFKTLGFQLSTVDSIVSLIDVRNENSKKVALRNGMKPTRITTWKNLTMEVFRIERPD